MEPRPLGKLEPHGWVEREHIPVSYDEVAKLFDPRDIATWHKQQKQRFKPVPRPTRLQRLQAWIRRVFQ